MAVGLPKVTDSTVYEGLEVSYGVAPILNTFSTLSTQFSRPKWNLYLINVETLIRNRKEDTIPAKELGRHVLNDMTVLAQYIAAYVRNNNSFFDRKKPAIFFYMAHYEDAIPSKYLRSKFPKGTERRWEVRNAIEQILTQETLPSVIDTVGIYYISLGIDKKRSIWPHKELLEDVRKQVDGAQFYKTLMISHVPLDFHLYRAFQDFTILESYTGALKQKKDLGKKVFKDENMSFNKYTHLVLGDKWYLGGLVDTKMKRELAKSAQKEHWNLLPDKGVLALLMKHKLGDSRVYIDPDI